MAANSRSDKRDYTLKWTSKEKVKYINKQIIYEKTKKLTILDRYFDNWCMTNWYFDFGHKQIVYEFTMVLHEGLLHL